MPPPRSQGLPCGTASIFWHVRAKIARGLDEVNSDVALEPKQTILRQNEDEWQHLFHVLVVPFEESQQLQVMKKIILGANSLPNLTP